jgi:S-adenosylmethionine hydrolase
MALVLFTDFGATDLYVGQMEAVLERDAPGVRVIHLLHEAPRFNPRASAHLLAALVTRMPAGHVYVAVVDPGVGSERAAVAVHADGNWFVGPDNGLLSVIAARATSCLLWRIVREPAGIAVSFHGRDLFAPLAATIARGEFPDESVALSATLNVALGPDDLAEIAYVDHYGNAVTGIRAREVPKARRFIVGGSEIGHGRVFSAVAPGAILWYENSVGLVEIAVNGGSAAAALGLSVGTPVRWA